MTYENISECRASGSKNLVHIMSLGDQSLTGVFLRRGQEVSKGPLDLMWCPDSGLLQLKQTYSLPEMYGETYGYRTGLNKGMVEHITNKAQALEKLIKLNPTDVVLDIGSNDGTLLGAYQTDCIKVGIDPTASKFKEFYKPGIIVIPQFFSAKVYDDCFTSVDVDIYQKPKIITSIAMFYDLQDPRAFVKDIHSVLADNGIWHFEQSYLPAMLRSGSYDTICHEHLEFYSLKVVKDILESQGMKILDVTTNAINGGSFAVTACKATAKELVAQANTEVINWMLKQEEEMGLQSIEVYQDFAFRAEKHAKALKDLLVSLVKSGKKVMGYGASTKGNVLLQYVGIDNKLVPMIADVNPDKWGKVTPGTDIEIQAEEVVKAMKPDYLLVLPWHFKTGILQREKQYMQDGGKFIFPLPYTEIV